MSYQQLNKLIFEWKIHFFFQFYYKMLTNWHDNSSPKKKKKTWYNNCDWCHDNHIISKFLNYFFMCFTKYQND